MYSVIKRLSKSTATFFVCLSVWLIAMLINAFADMAYMGFSHGSGTDRLDVFGFIILFSAMFSLPGIIIFWQVFRFNSENENLFRILLLTAVITPAVSVFLLSLFLGGGVSGEMIWYIIIAVFAGFIATALHYNSINTLLNKEE